MNVQVQKWGNSLAIRIPKTFVTETNLYKGAVVQLSVSDGKLVATPIPRKKYSLEEMLNKITEENLHPETDTGPVSGKEIW